MFTIAFTNRVAFTTGLRAIGSRYQFYCYTSQSRFIEDHLLELIVWPIVSILSSISFGLFSLLGIFSNARQIFQPDTTVIIFGELDNLLADDVVDMLDNTPFFTFQSLHCRSLACCFQLTPAVGKMPANLTNFSHSEEFGPTFRRTGNRQLFLSSINSQPSFSLSCIGNFHRATNERIPSPLLRAPQLERALLSFLCYQLIKDIGMFGLVNLQRDTFAPASGERKADRI